MFSDGKMCHRSLAIEKLLRTYFPDSRQYSYRNSALSWEFIQEISHGNFSIFDLELLLENHNISRRSLEELAPRFTRGIWEIVCGRRTWKYDSMRYRVPEFIPFDCEFYRRHLDHIISLGLMLYLPRIKTLREDFFRPLINLRCALADKVCIREDFSEDFFLWLLDKQYVTGQGVIHLCENHGLRENFYQRFPKIFHRKIHLHKLMQHPKLSNEFLFDCFMRLRRLYPRYNLTRKQISDLERAVTTLTQNSGFSWSWLVHPTLRPYTLDTTCWLARPDIPYDFAVRALRDGRGRVYEELAKNEAVPLTPEIVELLVNNDEFYWHDVFSRKNNPLSWDLVQKYFASNLRCRINEILQTMSITIPLPFLWGYDGKYNGTLEIYMNRTLEGQSTNFKLWNILMYSWQLTESDAQFIIDFDRRMSTLDIFYDRLWARAFMTIPDNVSWEFYERNYDHFAQSRRIIELCASPKLPVEFFQKHSELPKADAQSNGDRLLKNPFTYQLELETGIFTEQIVYDAQMAIYEASTVQQRDNLVNTILGIIRQNLYVHV